MAFYDESEEEQLDPEAQAGGVQTSSPSGVVSGGTPGGATPDAKAPGAPDKSGNFVGIKQYLDANKPQAAKLGDQASGVIDNSADQARTDITNLKQSFDQKVGTPSALDPEMLASIGQAEKLSSEQRGTLGSALKGSYGGPKDLMDGPVADQYTQANKSIEKARSNIAGSGTEEGRVNIISQINDKPRTTGITQFDNTLLSAGGGRQKLAQAAEKNKDLKDDVLGSANQEAKAKADQARATIEANKAQVGSALNQAKSGFQKSIDQKLQDAIAKALQGNIRVTQDLADLELEQETLDLFGLDRGDRTWGLDLNQYLKQGDPNSLNEKNIASAEDYARAQALAEIAGAPIEGFDNPALAGTGKAGPSVDVDRLRADLGGREEAYNTRYRTETPDANSIMYGIEDMRPMGNPNFNSLPSPYVSGSTWEQLENSWLPLFQDAEQSAAAVGQGGFYQQAVTAIQNALAKMRDEAGYTRQVNAGQKGGDAPRTAPGGGTVYYKGGK